MLTGAMESETPAGLAPKLRVMLLQAPKEFERVRDPIQRAQVHRRQVQQVTVFGVPSQQRVDACQRRNVMTCSGKFLQAKNRLL